MSEPRAPLRAVALGGGHGLHAALSALRLVTDELTAIVTVADDGGSSGRIRRELKVLPPGDLRMALAALAGDDPEHRAWAELLAAPPRRHRRAGRAPGRQPDAHRRCSSARPIRSGALARLAELVGAVGRVLPMSPVPLDLVGEADRFDPDDPSRTRRIRGQSSIAATPGRVLSVQLLPQRCAGLRRGRRRRARGRPRRARPGFVVHQRASRTCCCASWARRWPPRSAGSSSCSTSCRRPARPTTTSRTNCSQLLQTARRARAAGCPSTPCWPTPTRCSIPRSSTRYAREIGARLVVSRLAADDSAERHDPARLSEAIRERARRATAAGRDSLTWR